jgi:hypothetical protein
MWYLGAALAFAAGYLFQANRAEGLALFAAAIAVSFLGEHLSAQGRAMAHSRRAERAETRLASLHVEAEDERAKRLLAEQRLEELTQELDRLRSLIPHGEEKRERVERIISETSDEF